MPPDSLAAARAAAPATADDDSWGWLVTFSDLVLQLFAFMVLAALAGGGATTLQAPERVQEAPHATQGAQQKDLAPRAAGDELAPAADRDALPAPRVLLAAPAAEPMDVPSAEPEPALAAAAPAPASQPAAAASPPEATVSPRHQRVAALRGYLEQALATELASGGVTLGERDGALVVTIGELAGFAPGSAEPSPAIEPLLAELRAIAGASSDLRVEVSGHTDDRPIHTSLYPSNLELSLARASRVAHALAAGDDALWRRTFASGHGEQRPVASNADPAGRARNRRVEIRLVAP